MSRPYPEDLPKSFPTYHEVNGYDYVYVADYEAVNNRKREQITWLYEALNIAQKEILRLRTRMTKEGIKYIDGGYND